MWDGGGALLTAATGEISRGHGRFCSATPRCRHSGIGQAQRSAPSKAKGRGNAGFDQVPENPSDLRGIGDHGTHSHGGAAVAAAKGLYLVDFGQQPRLCET